MYDQTAAHLRVVGGRSARLVAGRQIGHFRDYRSQVRTKVLGSSFPAAWLVWSFGGAVTEQRVQRRLAAVLAADVVGYSALMQRAEEATYAEFERLKRSNRA